MEFYQRLLVIVFQVFVIRNAMVFCLSNKILLRRHEGMQLARGVFRTEETSSQKECASLCAGESSCFSVNYKKSGWDQGKCEMNNKLLNQSKQYLQNNTEFDYLEIVREVRFPVSVCAYRLFEHFFCQNTFQLLPLNLFVILFQTCPRNKAELTGSYKEICNLTLTSFLETIWK